MHFLQGGMCIRGYGTEFNRPISSMLLFQFVHLFAFQAEVNVPLVDKRDKRVCKSNEKTHSDSLLREGSRPPWGTI